MNETSLTLAIVISTLILEGIKYITRRYIVKDMNYSFPVKFYVVSIAVVNMVVAVALGYAGFEGYSVPADWNAWGHELVVVILQGVLQILGYNGVVVKFREYNTERLQLP